MAARIRRNYGVDAVQEKKTDKETAEQHEHWTWPSKGSTNLMERFVGDPITRFWPQERAIDALLRSG